MEAASVLGNDAQIKHITYEEILWDWIDTFDYKDNEIELT